MGVAIGVDSHKATMASGVVDEVGRTLEQWECRNNDDGHDAFIAWIERFAERVIGIEGSGSFGAALARKLVARGETVYEVPAFLTHRERKRAPARGKSDVADGEAIARVVARGTGLVAASAGTFEDLKLLADRHDQLKHARTQLANRIHKHLVVLCPGYGDSIGSLTSRKALTKTLSLVARNRGVRADLVRDHVAEIRRLDVVIAKNKKRITAAVTECGTTLPQLCGIGDFTAAKILGEIGDLSRLRSKAAFAMLNGTAPIPVSSGQVVRHRLNRGGNRQLNRALHTMAITCARKDGPTRDFVARQRAAGKTQREALRCLKRQLSNVVYRQLVNDFTQAAGGHLTT